MTKSYYVYILSNSRRTVLYTGVTNNLQARMQQHVLGASYFTKKYNVKHLVYFEAMSNIDDAIARENK